MADKSYPDMKPWGGGYPGFDMVNIRMWDEGNGKREEALKRFDEEKGKRLMERERNGGLTEEKTESAVEESVTSARDLLFLRRACKERGNAVKSVFQGDSGTEKG